MIEGNIDQLNFVQTMLAFICPSCGYILLTRRKTWERMKCPKCSCYIYIADIKMFYNVNKTWSHGKKKIIQLLI